MEYHVKSQDVFYSIKASSGFYELTCFFIQTPYIKKKTFAYPHEPIKRYHHEKKRFDFFCICFSPVSFYRAVFVYFYTLQYDLHWYN